MTILSKRRWLRIFNIYKARENYFPIMQNLPRYILIMLNLSIEMAQVEEMTLNGKMMLIKQLNAVAVHFVLVMVAQHLVQVSGTTAITASYLSNPAKILDPTRCLILVVP